MRNFLSVSISLLSLCFILIGDAKAGMGFDGVDEYVDTNTGTDIHSDYVTVSVWVKVPTLTPSGFPRILSKGDTAGPGGSDPDGSYGFTYGTTPYETFWICIGDTGNKLELSFNNSLMGTDTWHHIVGTFSSTSRELYLDGVLRDSDSHSADVLKATTQNLFISAMEFSDRRYFQGAIADVMVIPAALTATEVATLYASQGHRFPADSPPSGWWSGALNFAEGETMTNGTQIIDRSGNGYHGTAPNGAKVESPSQADAVDGGYAQPIPKHKRSRRR